MVLKSVEPDVNFINLYVYKYCCECEETTQLYAARKE
jgi:hypothetical protein